MSGHPAGLAFSFTEFSLLGVLLNHPTMEWDDLLRPPPSAPPQDHIEEYDLNLGEDELVGHMCDDAWQLCRRIGLVGEDGRRTESGLRLAATKPRLEGPLARDEDEVLEEVLATQIKATYLGQGGAEITGILQRAARGVAEREPRDWEGCCSGLLLGEFRHLIALAHDNADQAMELADSLPRTRARLVRGLKSKAKRTPIERVVLYADLVNGHHMEHMEALGAQGSKSIPTVTEGRATGMLLDCAGLLRLLPTVNPVHCLGPPEGGSSSLFGSVPVHLGDGQLWDRALQAGYIAELMLYLVGNNPSDLEEEVLSTLGIDSDSRKAADNKLAISARRIADHRHFNKGLAMELLTGLLLGRLDSARRVTCNCKTRKRQPHMWAPRGLADVEANYSVPAPGFHLVAEVSAKSNMNASNFRDQLDQALNHANERAEQSGTPVYALVLTTGRFATDKALQKEYKSFAMEKKLALNRNVRVVPMFASDFALAIQDIERNLDPKGFRFGAETVGQALNALSDRLLAGGKTNPDDWMRSSILDDVLGRGKPSREIDFGSSFDP